MKTKNIIYGVFIVVIVSGCGVPQSDYDKLKSENEQLKINYDECRYGEEKIVAIIKKAYAEKNYSLARINIILLNLKHPESNKNIEFKKLLKKIKAKEKQQNKTKAAKEKERIRLANINNTGIWSINYYVDDFGEYTKEGYIRNAKLIKGKFSNTATENSNLNVRFIITNSSNISIKLYEYAGRNPVKSSSRDKYKVLVQDKNGKRSKLQAINYSERLSFDTYDSKKIHKALLKGGEIKFRIVEVDTPTTQYKFTIQNADWYNNAYKKLKRL